MKPLPSPRTFAAALAAFAFLGLATAMAQPATLPVPSPGAAALAERQRALAGELAQSPFGLPLAVRSRDDAARAEGEIVGLVPHHFATFAAVFGASHAFCDVAVLHPNVKGCSQAPVDGGSRVTLYAGRKHYEPASGAHAQEYFAPSPVIGADYLRVVLRAPSGPLDTRDYSIELEAIPAGEATFVAVRYAYRPSLASRTATAGYLATVGSGKTGFSTGVAGEPARGVRGVVERNAMRHYLALSAVLDTAALPEAVRTAARLDRYYTLTERFAAQLREFERSEYLAIKSREVAEQRERDRHARSGS